MTPQIPWRDRLPTVVIAVNSVTRQNGADVYSWMHQHDRVTLNEGEMMFFIHKDLSGLVQAGITYKLWYARNDQHDRFVEVLAVERLFSHVPH